MSITPRKAANGFCGNLKRHIFESLALSLQAVFQPLRMCNLCRLSPFTASRSQVYYKFRPRRKNKKRKNKKMSFALFPRDDVLVLNRTYLQIPMVILAATLLFWGAAAGLSLYFSKGYVREQTYQARDDELALLLAETKQNPQNENAHLALAHALHSKSRERGDAQMLMQAVSYYHQVLKLNSDNADALLGISLISMETGILDKALEYLPKYLKLRPDDIQAKTDYAYALVSAERSKEGEAVLTDILEVEPQFVPALMTLAYLKRKAGFRQEAQETAFQALAASEDESIRKRISSFIAEDSEDGDSQGEVKTDSVDSLLPAQVITGYFKEHPIVSPKLERFAWKSPTQLLVYVKDFPAQDMTDADRGSFISKAEESLSLLPESIEIVLVSVPDNKPLLSLRAGKSVKR